eukprot:Ihof_evm2s773 gene=Ihof_evmTU2s773
MYAASTTRSGKRYHPDKDVTHDVYSATGSNEYDEVVPKSVSAVMKSPQWSQWVLMGSCNAAGYE